jgi:hypothetical protein
MSLLLGMEKLMADIEESNYDSFFVFDANEDNDGLKWILNNCPKDIPLLRLGDIYQMANIYVKYYTDAERNKTIQTILRPEHNAEQQKI